MCWVVLDRFNFRSLSSSPPPSPSVSQFQMGTVLISFAVNDTTRLETIERRILSTSQRCDHLNLEFTIYCCTDYDRYNWRWFHFRIFCSTFRTHRIKLNGIFNTRVLRREHLALREQNTKRVATWIKILMQDGNDDTVWRGAVAREKRRKINCVAPRFCVCDWERECFRQTKESHFFANFATMK